MGQDPSKFMSWESEKKAIEYLQQQILEYLGSEDYAADPYRHFNYIAAYGYESLEEFIAEIPSSDLADEIIYRTVAAPAPKLGTRYVVGDDPGKRGALVKPITNDNLAILRMDPVNLHETALSKAVNIVSRKISTRDNLQSTYNLDQLLLEKEFLKGYLQGPSNPLRIHHDIYMSLPNLAGVGMGDDQADLLNSDSEDETEFSRIGSPTLPKIQEEETETQQDEITETTNKVTSEAVQEKSAIRHEYKNETSFAKNGPVGTHKGIEASYNSSYLDALLFCMFYTTQIFDFMLKPKSSDDEYMEKARQLLTDNIVAPLREIYYCDYESVLPLREHLAVHNPDLMGAALDVEQFLCLLCKDILKETEFLQYTGKDNEKTGEFMHLLRIDDSDPSKITTVQRSLETSFAFSGDIKMANVPSPAFILGMTKASRQLTNYEAVIPNMEINIDSFMTAAECHKCGAKADWEMQQSSDNTDSSVGISICSGCITPAKETDVSKIVSRTKMRLISIICLREGHFTTFVRINDISHVSIEKESTWYHFDSSTGGYPEVKSVANLESLFESVAVDPESFSTQEIPALEKCSLTDGHLFIYEPVPYKFDEPSSK